MVIAGEGQNTSKMVMVCAVPLLLQPTRVSVKHCPSEDGQEKSERKMFSFPMEKGG